MSDLVLNGDATTAVIGHSSVLRLTPATFSQSGSAFSQTIVNAANFSTYFSFRIFSPGGSLFDCNSINGADGLVFVAQSVSSSAGVAGGGIGYSGIGNSLGVEWDTWCNAANNDPSSNHIGVNINGSVNRGAGSPHTANIGDDTVREDGFDNGEIWHAWVDYDGTTVEVRTNQTGCCLISRVFSTSRPFLVRTMPTSASPRARAPTTATTTFWRGSIATSSIPCKVCRHL